MRKKGSQGWFEAKAVGVDLDHAGWVLSQRTCLAGLIRSQALSRDAGRLLKSTELRDQRQIF